MARGGSSVHCRGGPLWSPGTGRPDWKGKMRQVIAGKQQSSNWLIIVRVAWCVVALLVLGLVIGSTLSAAASLHTLSPIGLCGKCSSRFPAVPGNRLEQLLSWLDGYSLYCLILCIIFALSCFVVAGVLVWRKPDNRMAMFAAFFLTLVSVMFFSQLPFSLPLFWRTFDRHTMYLGLTGLFVFFYLFPMGQLRPWWSGGLAIIAIFYWGTYTFFADSSLNFFARSPLLSMVVQYGLVLGIALVLIYRYRRLSDTVLRRQTRWVVFGGSSAAFLDLVQQYMRWAVPPQAVPGLLLDFIPTTLFFISLLLIPLSIGIAILRSRLWNIDIIIHRALVYGALSTCVVGLYVLVVGGLGTLFQAQGNVLLSLLATGLIAVLFHPLRQRLQRAVNYLVYGERSNPYQVLSLLGLRLETTLVPDAVLPTIVETVAQAFNLPYAAITLKQDEGHITLGAVYGQAAPEDALLHFALTYQGEFLGELTLSNEPSEEAFSARDRRLLEDLVRQAGVAVHAVRLSADIRRSREQLVMTREEERRRLRRDLHDGLGPQLASLMLMLTTVRKLLRKEPDMAEHMLTEAMTHMQGAIADIRHLVYGLRPPALDDLGLLGLLQEDMQRYRACGVTFTLDAPDPLPPLPAAVEVACYRIAQEALTNVIKHAHAQHCVLRLGIDEMLTMEVIDDGEGFADTQKGGVGLTSMRERALELGGTCSIGTQPQKGTHVSVCLPLR
jgi:signal transduction histidine kinase